MVVAAGLATLGPTPSAAAGRSPCGDARPVRAYDLVALEVDITLNRYLDHDPDGRMYALADRVDDIRSEEAANAAARRDRDALPGASLGLQGDAIQPLVIRARPGECLSLRLQNDLEAEDASIHVHGADLLVATTGEPAVTRAAESVASPGADVAYTWAIPQDAPEATHYFHAHEGSRRQTGHGLFGAVVVEPPGATWLDPRTGGELASGWDAAVIDPDGPDFREFAILYHEIGDEKTQVLDADDNVIPLVEPLTSAYRPATRAMNYRSEPFGNRLQLQADRAPVGDAPATFDEAVAYSSYAFGDPATPILRSYVGDPAKERIIHAGAEVFHVHHLHGGAVRWRRQPGVENNGFARGLDKAPPLLTEASERTDSQTLGPSETFDIENECGSGGCQQSAGDFLYHCHVAQHYFAGMWGLWRTYNTLQDGAASTDNLAPLRELPDRATTTRPAVTSAGLIGSTIDPGAGPRSMTAAGLSAWLADLLPPAGVARGYDASVFDWTLDGDLALGEPETVERWPGYRSAAPGERPALLFDPSTGKLAYPFLRPHLGRRPPFAPRHGPAPFLDPVPAADGGPPVPGANGPASVCPRGSHVSEVDMHAIRTPITVSPREGIVDANGLLFARKEDLSAMARDPNLRGPLVLRANAGETCVDVVLSSDLDDDPESHFFSKVNAHIHFVQFDVQGSDGVVAGFNYEQSVRPFRLEGTPLSAPSAAGDTTLRVQDTRRFQPGVSVGVGFGVGETFETVVVSGVDASTGALALAEPLTSDHRVGEVVSVEFVRYRWFADSQFGTAYFHDHVNAIATWRHGLFGALVVEPPGSTYHDPHTGEEIASGALADIHTDSRVSTDVTGSFREIVSFLQDDSTVNHVGRSTGSALNLRASPLAARGGDPAEVFSSLAHGDPVTPLLEAYVGDPVVVRSLVGSANEVHTFHVDGHWFRPEPQSSTSAPASTVRVGISERFDLVLPSAGGPQHMAGDYLYQDGRPSKLLEGSWGLLRVMEGKEGSQAGLRRLPGRSPAVVSAPEVCPADAPVRRVAVAAVDAALPMLDGATGRIWVPTDRAAAVAAGERQPEPLVVHIGVGDCLEVAVTNLTDGGNAVSLWCDLLAYDPSVTGAAVGRNAVRAVAPGATSTSTFYASPEVGETVAVLRDGGDPLASQGLGLYGAVVVGPAGATYRDSVTGGELPDNIGWSVDVLPADGPAYRDATLVFHDEDDGIGTHRMPYTTKVGGPVAVNYQTASGSPRAAGRDEPTTPTVRAVTGDPMRIHVLAPWSEQVQVFSLEGHQWPVEPGRKGTSLVSSAAIGGLEAMTLRLDAGAGAPGTYVYGNHREPFRDAGAWGLFMVTSSAGDGLAALPGRGAISSPWWLIAGPPSALLVVGAVLIRRRTRARRGGQQPGPATAPSG